MAMLGKRRPPRRASGNSGLARTDKAPTLGRQGADASESTLTVERLAHDGRGIAHNGQGKAVFVDQALPGEQVEVAVHRTRKRFDEAHVKARLSASAERVTPPCRYFGQCGGCDLQHLAVDAQRRHKRDVIIDLLARQGIQVAEVGALEGEQTAYRRRARLGVKVDNQEQVLLGFRARDSHRLIDVEQCLVLEPSLQALLPELRALLATLEAPRQVGHIELVAANDAPLVLVRQLKHHAGDAQRWAQLGQRLGVAVGAWVGREAPALYWHTDVPRLEEPLSLAALGIEREVANPDTLTLGFAPGDFLQVNAAVNRKMIAQVVAWLDPHPGQQLLDMFAGIGNFSLPLAAAGATVHAVEGSQAMVERIGVNAAANQLPVSAEQADLSDDATVASLLRRTAAVDALVLDPPRSGAEAICRQMGRVKVPKIAYISCDPATLARDAAQLLRGGYRVKEVVVADMFLHTAHLETLMLFEYAG